MPKVLIVFTDKYLAYSPTTLNIYYSLKNKGFDPEIIAEKPAKHFDATSFDNEKVKFITWKSLENLKIHQKVIRKINNKLKKPNKLLTEKAKAFIAEIQKSEADTFIAIDFFSLWCLQFAGKKAHVVSLELYETDIYLQQVNTNQIESVIIQSKERFDYLFPDKATIPYHIVQNSPGFTALKIDINKRDKYSLIYCGTCYINFGIITCLEFIKDFPEYTLTVIGAMPADTQRTIDLFFKDLLDSGRLKIDTHYYELEELTKIISSFRIGLVFYDIYHYINLQKFNTYSIPSGKLYQYFNSGLPVVGNKLLGFSIVEEQKAGALVSQLTTLQIKKAIDTIESDYESYVHNAKKISRVVDSKVAIEDFIKKAIENN